ncbi:hypothetical protein EMIT0111MI5_290045 [Burkholderia sp. IT-111MI5]
MRRTAGGEPASSKAQSPHRDTAGLPYHGETFADRPVPRWIIAPPPTAAAPPPARPSGAVSARCCMRAASA